MISLDELTATPEFQSASEKQKQQVLSVYARDMWTEVLKDPVYTQASDDERKALETNFDSRFGQETRLNIEKSIDDEKRGFLGNMWQLVKQGGSNAKTAAILADDVAKGHIDANTASTLAESFANDSRQYVPPELQEIQQGANELTQEWEGEGLSAKSKALWDTVKFIASQSFGNPKGMAYLSAQQVANMAPGLAGTIAGGKSGAVAGALGGPVAAATGAVVGGAIGGFLGQWGIEAGSELKGMISDELSKRNLEPTEENIMAVLADDQFIDNTISRARKKATATSAVSVAMNLSAGRIAAAPYRAAVKSASAQLGSTASKDAVKDLAKQILASRTIAQKAGTYAGAVGTQLAEEPVSEAAGQVAKGDFQLGEVALETLGGVGGVVTELPAARNLFTKGAQYDNTPVDETKEITPEPIKQPSSILEAESLDDAIAAFNSVVAVPETIPVDILDDVSTQISFQPLENTQEIVGQTAGQNQAEPETDITNLPQEPAINIPESESIPLMSAKPWRSAAQSNEFINLFAQSFAPDQATVKQTTEVIENKQSAAAGHEVATNPTEPQKEAGNYKKAHVQLDGMNISIENPVGSKRSGVDAQGKPWSTDMKNDYGYIKGTTGKDKDHVDVFIAPGYEGGAEKAYVVNQYNKDGSFDEHKTVLGAESKDEALSIYKQNYEKGWTGGKSVVEMPIDEFKSWAKSEAPKSGPLTEQGEFNAEKTGKEITKGSTTETPQLVPGEEGRIRVRNDKQNREQDQTEKPILENNINVNTDEKYGLEAGKGKEEIKAVPAIMPESSEQPVVEKLQENKPVVTEENKAIAAGNNENKIAQFDTGHAKRVSIYASELGKAAGLTEKELNDLSRAASLHDLGKITIPENILNKAGKLTDNEKTIVEQHTTALENILKNEPEAIRNAASQHHENWNGTGYPGKLKGNDISKLARVIAVSDIFDALTTERSYKKAWTKDEALAKLQEYSGRILDPDLVPKFADIINNPKDEKFQNFLNGKKEEFLSKQNSRTLPESSILSIPEPPIKPTGESIQEALNRHTASLVPENSELLNKLVKSGKIKLFTNDQAIEEAAKAGVTKEKSNGTIYGIESKGKVYLVPENIPDGDMLGALRHSMGVHIGRMLQGSEEFSKLRSSVLMRADEKSKTGEAIRRAMARVPANTPALNYSEEVLAYMVSHNEPVSMVRRAVALVKSALSRFGISYKIFNEQDFNALADIAMRREARPGRETSFDTGTSFQVAPISEETKFQMAGPLSASSENSDKLSLAKAMKSDKIDRHEIWKKTGWWEMVPGEWQYEIDDSLSNFNMKKFSSVKKGESIKLPEIYTNKELFNTYPHLNTIKVKSAEIPEGVSANWLPESRTIVLNKNIVDGEQARIRLVHEIQHSLQDIENFSRGGSFQNIKKTKEIQTRSLMDNIIQINDKLRDISKNGEHDFSGRLTGKDFDRYLDLMTERAKLNGEYGKLDKSLIDASINEYRRLTGEAQARLVQYRLDMTPAQRKAMPPWVSLESMLMNEGLLQFNQKPEDVLISKYDPTIASDIVHTPKQSESIAFLDRVKGSFDYEGYFDRIATYLWDQDKAISRIQSRVGAQPVYRDYATIRGLSGKRIASAVKTMDKEKLQPILQFMADNKIEMTDLEKFLHAQHAPERNLQMRRVNARRYIDGMLSFMTDAEKEPWKKGLGTIQDEFVMNKESRNTKRDKTVTLLEKLVSNIRNQRSQVDSIAEQLANRQWTDKELEKGTDVYWQKRLDNMYSRLGKRESIADSWELVKDKLSGMTDKEAADIEKKFSGNKGIQDAANMVRSMNQEALDILYRSGELTEEEYNAINGTYQFHVPLMREDMDEGKAPTGRYGRGPLGKPVQIAAGSTKGVVDIFSHIVDRYQAAMTRSIKLESERALYDLIKENPDENIWSIAEMEKAPYYDHEGNIRYYPDQQLNPKYNTYIKVDGKKHIIEVNRDNPEAVRFMEALNRQVTPLGPITRAMGSVTRLLSRLNTSLTPEFTLPNFIRDIQTAVVNMSGTEADSMKKEVFGNIRKAIAGIYKEERGKDSGEWGAIYKDASANGVIMGWAQSYDKIETLSKKIEYDLAVKKGGHKTRETFTRAYNLIESVNLAIENGVRVSTYQALVNHGIEKPRAAKIASNLTIDFTKHGTVGPFVNSWWMFTNAGIQGFVRNMQAISGSKKVRKIVTGIVGYGVVHSLASAWMGGADTDGENRYDKLKRLNPALFERNIIFMMPDGKYFRIPMAYGYNMFFKLGEEIGTVLRGGNKTGAVVRVGTTIMNNLNPLAAGTLLQTVSPTLLDPLAQIKENTAWHGGPVMPALNPFQKQPDSERYFSNINPVTKAATTWINEMTGGSKYREGAISVSPESVELIIDTFTGGAGKFTKDALSLPVALYKGEVSARNIPVVRRLVGDRSDYLDRQAYSENRENMRSFILEYKNAIGDEKTELIKRPEYKLINSFKQTEKRLRALFKVRKHRIANKLDTEAIDSRINELQVEFDSKYNKYVGK